MTYYNVKRLALVLSIQAEIEGMKATNKKRELEEYAILYVCADFDAKAEELKELAYKHDEQL